MESYLSLSKFNTLSYLRPYKGLNFIWDVKLKNLKEFCYTAQLIYDNESINVDVREFTILEYLDTLQKESNDTLYIKFLDTGEERIKGFCFYLKCNCGENRYRVHDFVVCPFTSLYNTAYSLGKEIAKDVLLLAKESCGVYVIAHERNRFFPIFSYIVDELNIGSYEEDEEFFPNREVFFYNISMSTEEINSLTESIPESVFNLGYRELCLGTQKKTLNIGEFNTIEAVENCKELRAILNSPVIRIDPLLWQSESYLYINNFSWYSPSESSIIDFLKWTRSNSTIDEKVKFIVDGYWLVGMSYYCVDKDKNGELHTVRMGDIMFKNIEITVDRIKNIYYNMLEHLEHTKDACWGVRKDDIFVPYYKKLCSYFPNSIIEEKIDGIWFTIKGKSQQNFTDEEWKELKTKILEEI